MVGPYGWSANRMSSSSIMYIFGLIISGGDDNVIGGVGVSIIDILGSGGFLSYCNDE